jgi:Uma2 family endonuclease
MSNAADARIYRFSVEQYYKMGEVGIFHEDDPVELLNGTIVVAPAFSVRHIKASRRLQNVAFHKYGNGCLLDVRNPLMIDGYSVLQPDLALLRRDLDESRLPVPGEVLLLVEIADQSLPYDLCDKRVAYARSGIVEYWLLDLPQNQMHIFRDPGADGYRSERIVSANESIAPLAFPDVPIPLNELFSP